MELKEEEEEINKKDKGEDINIKQLSKKKKISTSDLILTILELCSNPEKYSQTNSSTGSKNFWQDVCSNKTFQKIFKNYSYDTLRKYSTELRKANSIEKEKELVKKNASIINRADKPLKYVINVIADYVNDDLDIDEFSTYFYLKIHPKKDFYIEQYLGFFSDSSEESTNGNKNNNNVNDKNKDKDKVGNEEKLNPLDCVQEHTKENIIIDKIVNDTKENIFSEENGKKYLEIKKKIEKNK